MYKESTSDHCRIVLTSEIDYSGYVLESAIDHCRVVLTPEIDYNGRILKSEIDHILVFESEIAYNGLILKFEYIFFEFTLISISLSQLLSQDSQSPAH